MILMGLMDAVELILTEATELEAMHKWKIPNGVVFSNGEMI